MDISSLSSIGSEAESLFASAGKSSTPTSGQSASNSSEDAFSQLASTGGESGGGQASMAGSQGGGSLADKVLDGAGRVPGAFGMLSEGAKAALDRSKGDKAGESEALHNMNPLTAMSRDATALKDPNSMTSQLVHTGLDVGGMVPELGTVTEGANAALYAAQGQYGNAATSAMSAIPVAGDVTDSVRLGKDATGLAGSLSKTI